jgi:hypothetical protein
MGDVVLDDTDLEHLFNPDAAIRTTALPIRTTDP